MIINLKFIKLLNYSIIQTLTQVHTIMYNTIIKVTIWLNIINLNATPLSKQL